MNYDFENIKKHYIQLTHQIFDAYFNKKWSWVSPYSHMVDWETMFSPIERHTWSSLRMFGGCPLYPQYPVGRYFSDFGHPAILVALECDGKEWHLDKEKDRRRDEEFYKLGWSTFRVDGSACIRMPSEFYDLDHHLYSDNYRYKVYKEFYSTTVRGLIKAIAIFYFDFRPLREFEIELAYECLINRVAIGKENLVKKLDELVECVSIL